MSCPHRGHVSSPFHDPGPAPPAGDHASKHLSAENPLNPPPHFGSTSATPPPLADKYADRSLAHHAYTGRLSPGGKVRMIGTALAATALLGMATAATPKTFTSTGNPILADGSYYSADAAPIVVNDTLYIISGHDTAPANVNSFIMNDWLLWSTQTPSPAGGDWTLTPDIAEPQTLFSWAKPGTAYAAQIVQGPDSKFYLYAPVTQSQTSSQDPFAIGVAVADSITGPWTDAHPSGPIISESVTGNTIQNIDPTVLVDDGKVYIYWGTFNQLYGVELETDMVTPVGKPTHITTLTGYFEAPWLMKRNETYYLLYAANNAGASSACTPTTYHACIAYGSSPSPLGPWTFRGTVLPIVSSTTSHPGVFSFADKYYMTYHTADATGGGNFRRSIAFDELDFDDTTSPPSITQVKQTFRPAPAAPPTRNVAPAAKVASDPVAQLQYWNEAVHDLKVPSNPLPPEYWSSYVGDSNPASATLTYTWTTAQELNGTRVVFFADQQAGASVGVAPPASWSVEYLAAGTWTAVQEAGEYPTAVTDSPAEVGFDAVSTTGLRVKVAASGGGPYAGVGVKEWEALSTTTH